MIRSTGCGPQQKDHLSLFREVTTLYIQVPHPPGYKLGLTTSRTEVSIPKLSNNVLCCWMSPAADKNPYWNHQPRSLILKDIGFKWGGTKKNRKLLVECSDIGEKRITYFRAMKRYPEMGRPIIFMDESYILSTHVKSQTTPHMVFTCQFPREIDLLSFTLVMKRGLYRAY